MKIIFNKINSKMQSSFWYQGVGDIAVFINGKNKLILSTCGEIRVKLKNEKFYRKNQNAIVSALKYEFNDDDIDKLEFDENNWFDFVYKKGNNDFIEIDGDECFIYDDALEKGKKIINDIKLWDSL